MKKITKITLVLLVIIILGGGGYVAYTEFIKEEESTKETAKELTEEGKDKSIIEGDEMLQKVCQIAIDDYPQWTTETGIVIYEKAEKEEREFFYRKSCETPSVMLTSPGDKETRLLNLNLVDKDVMGYATMSLDNKWTVGLMNMDLAGPGASPIYEAEEVISILDVSFINKDEFLMLYTASGKTILRYIDTRSREDRTLLELNSSSIDKEEGRNTKKISVSPKGTYAYMFDTVLPGNKGALKIFNLSSKEQIDEIPQGVYPVWIGDSHILYSKLGKGGVFLYDVKSGNKYQVSKIDSQAQDLAFNPESGGLIAYNTDSQSDEAKGHIIGCQGFKTQASYPKGIIEAFTDKETAIVTSVSEDESRNSALAGSGFWRFSIDWTVVLSEKMASYYSRPALATAWNRY